MSTYAGAMAKHEAACKFLRSDGHSAIQLAVSEMGVG